MSEHLNSMEDLFKHELEDLYSAETQLLEAIPKMASAATNSKLKESFQKHLEETERQLQRLEEIAESAGIELDGKTCKGMQGLIQEGEEIIKSDGDPSVKDAALIGAAQRVEHYEIAGYGTVRAFAEVLGKKNIASRLQTTLNQEGRTDEKLTSSRSPLSTRKLQRQLKWNSRKRRAGSGLRDGPALLYVFTAR